jgi:hypothetical protein
MIVLRGIPFASHCEHHMAPILGRAWVAYMPNGRVNGPTLKKFPNYRALWEFSASDRDRNSESAR